MNYSNTIMYIFKHYIYSTIKGLDLEGAALCIPQ